jgi:hypothetical protein
MSMVTMRRLRALLVAGLMGGALACNSTPVDPTPTPTVQDLFFSSQLMAAGTTSRTFTTPKQGDVKVFFSSLIPDSSAVIGVGLGTFDGTTCTLTTTVMVKSGSAEAVITAALPAGTYCVRVWDPGVLTKTNDFSFTINIPFGS